MKIVRTKKQFSKRNMPLEFLRKALSLAGAHSSPLKFNKEDFIIEEKYHGEKKGSTVTPWTDGDEKRGYKKVKYIVRIKHNKGFDCFAYICTSNAKLVGYYKETGKIQYPSNQIEWINLLLEYGFVKIE